ncbi:MAG: hypothetical protein ABI868_16685 [Acidobacteriota bacterium]
MPGSLRYAAGASPSCTGLNNGRFERDVMGGVAGCDRVRLGGVSIRIGGEAGRPASRPVSAS